MALGLVLFALALAAGRAEVLTQGERDRAMSDLHATRKRFLDSVAGLSDAQWKFKPDDKTWSIAECAEHIAISEDAIFQIITGKILKSPAAPEKRGEVQRKDELVMKAIRDRSGKFSAPESLKPSGRWPTPDAMVAQFKKSRDSHIAYIQTTQDDLRSHFLPHPATKEIDGYQWLLLLSAHSDRHVMQILDVKGHPGYPK
ncbi:MAG: DinB family protein [Bryobacteraceae bacterium]